MLENSSTRINIKKKQINLVIFQCKCTNSNKFRKKLIILKIQIINENNYLKLTSNKNKNKINLRPAKMWQIGTAGGR